VIVVREGVGEQEASRRTLHVQFLAHLSHCPEQSGLAHRTGLPLLYAALQFSCLDSKGQSATDIVIEDRTL
jgi:hypothetical protein